MEINWIARIKNKTFWLTITPAILLLVQAVLKVFNIEFSFEVLEINLMEIINAVFLVLSILGIVVDPTTIGINDSQRAMTYDEPN